MPHPLDYPVVALIVFGLPARAWFGMRTLKRTSAASLPGMRLGMWRRAMLAQWTLVALVAALWIALRRDPAGLGLIVRPTRGLIGVLVGLAIVVGLILRQIGQVDRDPDLRARLRARLAGAERLMPRPGEPFGWFAALALTAGVCEELLFRGYLLWFFTLFLPWWGAAAAQAACFGIAHAYQGRKGVVLTGAAGAFMTLVYALTGSLAASMLIHFLMDLHAGELARRSFGVDDGAGAAPA